MRRVVLIVAAIFVFTEALSVGIRADQQQVPQGQGGAPAPARQGGQGQAGQGQAGQGQAGQGRQGGSNVQDVVGGVNQPQGGAQGQGRGGAGGRGRAAG